jgi:outer membrane protein assembly factor BamE (lipoprotein component of BamABCDE complex)
MHTPCSTPSLRLRTASRALALTGLLLGATIVQAAGGFTIRRAQETQITAGMSRQDVMQMLGRPAHNLKFRSEPGRTWTYGVNDAAVTGASEAVVFDVEFGADGKVLATSERTEALN